MAISSTVVVINPYPQNVVNASANRCKLISRHEGPGTVAVMERAWGAGARMAVQGVSIDGAVPWRRTREGQGAVSL
jgi:hypothetical protein